MSPFLTAHWSYLLMMNFCVDPALLQRFVPKGTELDAFEGRTYASIVGFLFLDTRLKGIPVPFHRNFEEINLRFYVRRETQGEVRRGVVFIKEIVPKAALAAVARICYNENYVRHSMRHSLDRGNEKSFVRYEFDYQGKVQALDAEFSGDPKDLATGSVEEFITEHYWGYARQRDGGTVEYRVEHPRWRVWFPARFQCRIESAKVYGQEFAGSLDAAPSSVILAEGSPVAVYSGQRIASPAVPAI